ncbi:MAG: hypothetical protein ABIK99_06380, partial [candidate division WOR-3 bacterium]
MADIIEGVIGGLTESLIGGVIPSRIGKVREGLTGDIIGRDFPIKGGCHQNQHPPKETHHEYFS